jgi:DNA polymerase-3 subunit beta
MRFGIEKSVLLDAMKTVIKACPSKSIKPILENVHIRPEDGALTFSCTDLEICIDRTVGNLSSEGVEDIIIPAHRLFGIVSESPEGSILIESVNEVAKIKTTNGSFSLPCCSVMDYPRQEEGEGQEEYSRFNFNGPALAAAINGVAFCASKEGGNYALAGVCLSSTGGELAIAATDTFRLGVATVETETNVDVSVIVPLRAIKEIGRIATYSDTCSISIGSRSVIFEAGGTTIQSRTIEAKYPNFRAIMPKVFNATARTLKADLYQAVRQAANIVGDDCKVVITCDDGKEMVIRTDNSGSTSDVRFPAVVDGAAIDVTVNYKYLLESIGAVSGEYITLELNGSESPIRIKEGNIVNVISPVART